MTKSEHQKRVEELMRRAGQAVPTKPGIPSLEVRRLRAKLILEEAMETIEALGFEVEQIAPGGELKLSEYGEPNLVEIVDGCADIIVVTTGTLSAHGVADEAILKAVDENNLGKFGPGSYRREDGKWIKPAGHQPPDILGLLALQGYEASK
jgi:predicted HAD superfamily Cof-like phosphohydrolase